MVVEFRPYRKGDVFELELRVGDDYGSKQIYEYEDDVIAFTLLEDDKPIMCWGIVEMLPGVGHMWAYITDEARGHGIAIVRHGRRIIDRTLGTIFHRLQSNVRADSEEYMRFTELFGFEKEGLMRQATADRKDLWMYARVR